MRRRQAAASATALLGAILLWTVLGLGQGSARGSALRPADDQPTPTLELSPIQSVFLPDKLATEYTVVPSESTKGAKVSTVWTLSLELVDKKGAHPANRPDEAADVDLSCDNSVLAGGAKVPESKQVGISEAEYEWRNQGDDFVWYHGDKGAYPNAPVYGCDHTKMGPSGHEGHVRVVVSDGYWECLAIIDGTNLTPQPVNSGPARCDETDLGHALRELAAADDKLDGLIARATQAGKEHRPVHNLLGPAVGIRKAVTGAIGPVGPIWGSGYEGGWLLGLVDVDRRLTAAQADSEDKHDAVLAFRKAAETFQALADALSEDSDLGQLATTATSLADSAGKTAKDLEDGELPLDQRKPRAAALAKAKLALIDDFPPLYGIPASKYYAQGKHFLDAIDQAVQSAAGNHQGGLVTSLRAARAAKLTIEAALAKAIKS